MCPEWPYRLKESMADSIATCLVFAVYVYALAGALFALTFVLRGVDKLDHQAKGSGWGFRVLIFPGCVVLWLFLWKRWCETTGESPEERNPAGHPATEEMASEDRAGFGRAADYFVYRRASCATPKAAEDTRSAYKCGSRAELRMDAYRRNEAAWSWPLNVQYAAIGWNPQKRAYDLVMIAGIVAYLVVFVGVSTWLQPGATVEYICRRPARRHPHLQRKFHRLGRKS